MKFRTELTLAKFGRIAVSLAVAAAGLDESSARAQLEYVTPSIDGDLE